MVARFIIVNNDTGKFVSPPGSEKSYTTRRDKARGFESREAAQRECCGNERVEERCNDL